MLLENRKGKREGWKSSLRRGKENKSSEGEWVKKRKKKRQNYLLHYFFIMIVWGMVYIYLYYINSSYSFHHYCYSVRVLNKVNGLKAAIC